VAERLAARLPFLQVIRGARVLSMEQTDDGVRVGFERDGRIEWLETDLLVGADGARSVVRPQVTAVFAGETYPETTLLATTRFPFQDHLPNLSPVNYLWWAEGTFSLLALPGLWRANFHLPPGTDLDAAARPEAIRALLERLVPGAGAFPVEQCRQYRLHRRMVDRYRRGRIVLAGDAAHLNSPAGGMGMNGGIHDAFELAATLLEIRDGASLDLLDRYERRRLPIARDDILRQADNNRARMQSTDPAARRAALTSLQQTAADPDRAREHLLRSSMILGLRAAAAIA
jgi:3-(3-hydroxy-phenyl)propionate hydroxylase